jgi:hypothetical protein
MKTNIESIANKTFKKLELERINLNHIKEIIKVIYKI